MRSAPVRDRLRPFSRRALAATACALAFGCVSRPDNRLDDPASADFQRALVLPMNLVVAMPEELADRAGNVDRELQRYLEQRRKTVGRIELPAAHDLWRASVKRCRESASPGCEGFEGAMRLLAQQLRDGREHDLLIVPYLTLRPAKTLARNVTWDGVRREIEVLGLPPDGSIALGSGTMNAPSLGIFAFSRDGDPVFRGVGGLDLAHRMSFDSGRVSSSAACVCELRDDFFEDPEALREGVAIALHPLVPESERGR